MQTQGDVGTRAVASAAQRKVIHDLRNLFAIIGAGTSLLARELPPARRKEVLAAMAEATRQGAQLTTELLANGADLLQSVIVDADERLAKLAPMMRVLTGARLDLAPSNRRNPLLVRTVPADFDAVFLELVANADVAGATAIAIRSRECQDRAWMLISDNGCGMSLATLARARRGNDLGLAHGTGLSRVRQFMEMSGGHLHIRSRPGHGTHIGLVFPLAPKTGSGLFDAAWSPARCPAGSPAPSWQKARHRGAIGYPFAA